MERKIIKNIKKAGCIASILIFLGIPVFFIGYFFYYFNLERNYVKIDEHAIITIWRNYIIFDQYWYPFYPKDNYIVVKTTWDYYDLGATITQDSVLGIWSNYPIEVYGMDEFKAIEIFKREEHENWTKRYSFANVSNARKDSLILEFNYQLWYPSTISNGQYIYRTDKGVLRNNFDD